MNIQSNIAAIALSLMATTASAETSIIDQNGPWETRLHIDNGSMTCEIINYNGDETFALVAYSENGSSKYEMAMVLWVDIEAPEGDSYTEIHLELYGDGPVDEWNFANVLRSNGGDTLSTMLMYKFRADDRDEILVFFADFGSQSYISLNGVTGGRSKYVWSLTDARPAFISWKLCTDQIKLN